MNTTAPASAPTAGPSWHTPQFTAHIKAEPCDGEAVDRIPPGPSGSASASGGPREDSGPSQHRRYFQQPQIDHHHQQLFQQELGSPPAVQTKQEVTTPPEGTSPQTPTIAAAAAASVSSHASTEGEGGLQRFLAAIDTMCMAYSGTIYECPLCTVRTRDKKEFRDHLGTHSVPRCPSCDLVAATVEQLHTPMRQAHALSPPHDDSKCPALPGRRHVIAMNTTAPASAPTAGPSWHTPQFTAHIKAEPCDGEAVDRIPPGPSGSASASGGPREDSGPSQHRRYFQQPQIDHHHQQLFQQELGSPPAVQTKQEVTTPPEGTSPQTPTIAAAAAASVSSHASTEGEGGLQRFLAAIDTMCMAYSGTIYECPLCTVRTRDKKEFRDHLGTHSVPRCPSCDLVAATVEQLHTHMRQAHALSPPHDDPKINSRGRVRTFVCKQCGYVSVTKLEFWTHSRCHIQKEKLLTCNRCPFVTKYKHHLESHLRNHMGWKPFHCHQCDYSCVNKSMLNAHLKWHSKVYQYRCADCAYAAKFRHYMKMHLRKYHHTPDVVLNPDGSPNPLPFTAVCRGRKQRPRSTSAPAAVCQAQSPAPPQPQRQPPLSVPRAATEAALPPFAPTAFAPIVRPGGVAFPFGNMGLLPSVPAFRIPHNASDAAGYDAYNDPSPVPSTSAFAPQPSTSTAAFALPSEDAPAPAAVPGPSATKHRHKGEAYRRECIAMKLQYNAYDESADEEPERKPEPEPEVEPQPSSERPEDGEDSSQGKRVFYCEFCEIAFRDILMYVLHMGYHGVENPFTCNACGMETANRLEFFLHFNCSPHS